MKYEVELHESPEAATWLASALAMGLLVSFRTLEEKERQATPTTGHEVKNFPRAPGQPFEHGDDVVVVKYSSLYPDIKVGDTGTVRYALKRGRGWAVEMDWDDNTTSVVSAGMLAARG